jgi:phthalate 4,5-dioxygenase oxygenase subunit
MTPQDNDLLCRVERGAPMWAHRALALAPALLSEEVPEPRDAGCRYGLLGEDLVAFRDSEGRVGPARPNSARTGAASLLLARNEDSALRCLYHVAGRCDATGNVLEMPSEIGGSTLCDRGTHVQPPTRAHEWAGVGWWWT